MTVEWIQVASPSALSEELAKHDAKKTRVFVYFSGSKDASGQSWCPDCVAAWPVVDKVCQEQGEEDDVFIYVDVGDRATWKDPNHPYRKDPSFKLTGVPTLLQVQTPKRLVEESLHNPSTVAMLLEED